MLQLSHLRGRQAEVIGVKELQAIKEAAMPGSERAAHPNLEGFVRHPVRNWPWRLKVSAFSVGPSSDLSPALYPHSTSHRPRHRTPELRTSDPCTRHCTQQDATFPPARVPVGKQSAAEVCCKTTTHNKFHTTPHEAPNSRQQACCSCEADPSNQSSARASQGRG